MAKELRQLPPQTGQAQVSLLLSDGHEPLMREASGLAVERMIVGSHRLGSTARPGVVIQGETAVRTSSTEVTLLYTMPSGPLKKRHARKLAEEAAENGVRLLRAEPPLHGKFLAWDGDDLAVTSLNWASSTGNADFPQADIGLHIHCADVASHTVRALSHIYPSLAETSYGEPQS